MRTAQRFSSQHPTYQVFLFCRGHSHQFIKYTMTAGFLAFREVETCLAAFKRLLYLKPQLAPDCVLLDGNGTLHPQGLGLACHFGITADVCTIGVAKNLYKMDDIVDQDKHIEKVASLSEPGSFFTMHNHSREILGVVG